MKTSELVVASLLGGALLVGCGDSGTSTGTDSGTDTTTAGTDTTAGTETTDTTDTTDTGNDTDPVGADCSVNEDCSSRVCEKFTDPATGMCVEAPANGNTRIMGTLRALDSNADVITAEINAVAALSAIGDPLNAESIVKGTSDSMGIFDFTSSEPIDAPIGLIALVNTAGYQVTATGLAQPISGNAYGPATTVRDIWAVPTAALDTWNAALMADMDFDQATLPLGAKGGVVGLVRDSSGAPLAGATVVAVDPDTSTAEVRYIDEAGTGVTTGPTSSNGLFILVKPGLKEQFTVTGVSGTAIGTAGSATKDAVFVMVLNVE